MNQERRHHRYCLVCRCSADQPRPPSWISAAHGHPLRRLDPAIIGHRRHQTIGFRPTVRPTPSNASTSDTASTRRRTPTGNCRSSTESARHARRHSRATAATNRRPLTPPRHHTVGCMPVAARSKVTVRTTAELVTRPGAVSTVGSYHGSARRRRSERPRRRVRRLAIDRFVVDFSSRRASPEALPPRTAPRGQLVSSTSTTTEFRFWTNKLAAPCESDATWSRARCCHQSCWLSNADAEEDKDVLDHHPSHCPLRAFPSYRPSLVLIHGTHYVVCVIIYFTICPSDVTVEMFRQGLVVFLVCDR